MKKSFTQWTFLAAVLAGGVMYAQQAPAPTDNQSQPAPETQAPPARQMHSTNPQKTLKHLSKKLALTGDQQNQILPILADRQQQVQAILNDQSLQPRDRRAKMKAVRDDSQSKLRAILTDNQRATYDQMLQQERERAHERRQTSVAN